MLLALALGVTGSVVAWGYLVYAAIDFGSNARNGDSAAWAYLALASVGAVACLFLGLILLARISRLLGITQPPPPRGHDQHVEADAGHDPDAPLVEPARLALSKPCPTTRHGPTGVSGRRGVVRTSVPTRCRRSRRP